MTDVDNARCSGCGDTRNTPSERVGWVVCSSCGMTFALPSARSPSQRLQALAEKAGEVTREKGKVAIERARLQEEIADIHRRVGTLEQRTREGHAAIRNAQADQARLGQEERELAVRIAEGRKTLSQLDDNLGLVHARRLPLALRLLVVSSIAVAAITWVAGVALVLRLEPVDGSFRGLTVDQVRWPVVGVLFAGGFVSLAASSRVLRAERAAKFELEQRLTTAQEHVRQRNAKLQSEHQALEPRVARTRTRIAAETKAIDQARSEAEGFVARITQLEKRHAELGEKEERFSVEAHAVREEIDVLLKAEEAAASAPPPVVEIRTAAAPVAAPVGVPRGGVDDVSGLEPATPETLAEVVGHPASGTARLLGQREASGDQSDSGGPPSTPPWLPPILLGTALVSVVTLCGLTTIAVSRPTVPPPPDPNLQRELARVAAEQREQERMRQVRDRTRQLQAQADLSTKEARRLANAWGVMLNRTEFPVERDLVGHRRLLISAVQRAIADQEAFTRYFAEAGVPTDTPDLASPAESLAQLLRDIEGARIVFTTVRSNVEWNDVGIDLLASDRVIRWARGTWSAGSRWMPCGPDGTDETAAFGLRDYRRTQAFKLMSLLLRVSAVPLTTSTTEATEVWVDQSAAAPHSGRLYAGCNDSDWENNEGQLDLAVVALSANSSLLQSSR